MKLWQKLGFIGLAFTIPLALTTNFLVHAKSSKINVAQAELDGITYLRPLVSLQVNVVTHATAERRVLAGDASAVTEQQRSSSAVNAALDQLTQVDAKLSSKLKTDPSHLSEANLGTSAPATLRAQWQTTLTATTVEASDQNHEQLIAGVEGLITQIGNTSNLILDPDLDTYYTMDALLLQEPAIVDVLGQIGRTAAALGSSGLTLNDRKQLSADAAVLSGHIENLTTDLETSFRTTKDYNHSTTLEPTISPLLQPASVQASSLNDALSQVVTQPGADPSLTANVSKDAVAAFNANAALWPPLLAQEAVMLDARKSREISSRSTSLLIVLAVLIVTAVLMVLVARRLVKDVDSLAKAARDLAEGDLTVRATVARKDEIGGLAVAFNQMAGRLEELSREVRDGAVGINTAASNILTSVSEQTAGAAQQSASLAQISVTTDELRTTAEVMLDRAEKMARQARDTLAVSRDGNQAVDDIRHGMEAIGNNVRDVAADILALAEQTQQIGEITSLVSELADQSNLLALNANIEAAKAGEQGKGFAVVAAQVRLLAEQSKQATSQVATILTEIQSAANAAVIATEAGNKVVEDGMERATRAGDVIGRLGETILQTAESSQQIADGLEEQKIAIDQISQAIGDVSQATNQYVAGTEFSQQTAQDLSELAGPLRELTERYKVGVAGDGHSAGAS